jgi:hypothetical protein
MGLRKIKDEECKHEYSMFKATEYNFVKAKGGELFHFLTKF